MTFNLLIEDIETEAGPRVNLRVMTDPPFSPETQAMLMTSQAVQLGQLAMNVIGQVLALSEQNVQAALAKKPEVNPDEVLGGLSPEEVLKGMKGMKRN